jgi:hypothetical protein
MARIPDATDFGERVIATRRTPEFASRAGEIQGNALSQLAQTVGNAAQQVQADQDSFNLARAKSSFLQADAAIQKELETDQEWQTHESRYAEHMKAEREKAGAMIRSPRARALFDMEAEQNFARATESVRNNARRVEGQWGRSTLDEALEGNRRAALESKDEKARGALVTGAQDAINGALAKGYISPEQSVQLRQAWTASYGEGFIEMQKPAEQLRLLRSPKGNPADFIDPAKRAVMIERLEDKMRIEGDKREAKAERAMAQWERAIASGYPPTAELRKEWTSAISGTSVQGELNQLMAGEAEVQKTLRMSVADQVRLVQEKDAALMERGGSAADIANMNRLKSAVGQNIKLMQTAPLLFAEKRFNEPVIPMDFTNILDEASRPEVAATFQERAAQIRAVEKTAGAAVPMRPLLPQEADQMASVLGRASPQQAADLFASLHEAAGSPDVYNGMLAQLVPDQPVKALAGMLSAKERALDTSDRTVTSRNVAATMLRGDSILNPSKADKSQDGQSKGNKLFLPSAAQKDLQSKFEKVVGDTFAGRQDAADLAYQAVQAYYVGRAAELGTLAADSESADSDIVKEAVSATVGNVVDFNGEGHVLAPWGMDGDDFEDRAERAIAARVKELKVKDDPDSFGLTNASGDGEYTLTLGRQLLLDVNGQPITINVKPVDLRDARGYIRRDK